MNELTLRNRSLILAGWIHGAFNGQAYGIWRILFPNVNPLFGGLTGLVGITVWLVVGLLEVHRGRVTPRGSDGPCLANNFHSEFVILLHGLARSKSSMAKIESRLSAEGYSVINLDYPSRSQTIEETANTILPKAIESCRNAGAKRIHFVTHSMGGIIVRYYLKHHEMQDLGRIVMLSPPNGGSEVVDKLGQTFIFKWLNGPAGQQLGTGEDSLPRQLGDVDYDVGIITGDRSINPIFSLIIPGVDDGTISVKSAKVKGMKDFIVIHATHPFIMKNSHAIEHMISFLRSGSFKKRSSSNKAVEGGLRTPL